MTTDQVLDYGRQCHDPYAEAPCGPGCHEQRPHTHHACDGTSGAVHAWVFYTDTGDICWFDLSQPARLVYPVYTTPRKRKARYDP